MFEARSRATFLKNTLKNTRNVLLTVPKKFFHASSNGKVTLLIVFFLARDSEKNCIWCRRTFFLMYASIKRPIFLKELQHRSYEEKRRCAFFMEKKSIDASKWIFNTNACSLKSCLSKTIVEATCPTESCQTAGDSK